MALTDCSELQQKLSSLKRTPGPKSSTNGNSELFNVKLKPVRPVEGNGRNTESDDKKHNTTKQERSCSIKERAKKFDVENGSPGVKPLITKKPPIGVKPAVTTKPVNPLVNNEVPRRRPPSVRDKPAAEIQPGYEDNRVPELVPLKSLRELGNPPAKPPKLWPLKKSLEKYIGTSHPARPVVPDNTSGKVENDEDNPAVALPGGAPPIPKKPTKPGVNTSNENEAKMQDTAINSTQDVPNNTSQSEDFYDDTACSVSQSEDFYDDTTCSNDIDTGTQDEKFGEDIYEPLAEQNVFHAGTESPPPTLPPHTEKKTKEHTKEDKKKKEKEEKEKRKKEKEEKEKEEKERKKREKEKEKKFNDMKRRFSVRGNERALGTCCAAVDIQGNKMDISATIGEVFDIIRKDKPNPPNKWLVRNKLRQYGFIDIDKLENDNNEESEDLYEEVSTVKESMQALKSDDIPAPPKQSPPPPPGQNTSTSAPDNQEIYDDVASGEADEQLYELPPGS